MPPMHRPHGHHKRYYKADEVPDTLRSVAEKAQLYCDALEVSGIDSKIEIEQRFRGGDFKISVWVMNENGDVDKFLNFKYNGQVIGSVMGYVPSAYDGEPIHKAIESDKDMTFEVDGYIAKVQDECKEKGYEDIADAMKVLKMEQFRTSPEKVQELNNIIDPFCADIDEYIDKTVLMPEKAMCGKNAVLLDKKEVFADEKDTDLQCILVTAMEFQRDQNALFAKEGKGGFVDVQIVDDGNPLTKPVVVVAIYDNERAVNKEQPSKMFHLKDNPLDFTLTGYKTTQFVLDNGELVKSDVKMDFEKYSTDVAKKAFDTQIKVMHELYDEEAKNTISDGYSVERNYDIVTFGKPNMSNKDVSDMVTQMTNLCYRCASAMDKDNPDREKEVAIACVENNFTPLDFSFVKDMPFDKTAIEMPQAEEVGFVTALALSNGDTAFIYNRSIAVGDKTIDLGDKPFVAVNEFGEDITQRLLATMDKVNTVDKCREEIIHTANEMATDKKNNYYGERAEQYISERLERAESGQKSPVQHHKQTGMDK